MIFMVNELGFRLFLNLVSLTVIISVITVGVEIAFELFVQK